RRQPAVRLVDRPLNLLGVHLDGENDLRARLALGIDPYRCHGDLRYQFAGRSPTSNRPLPDRAGAFWNRGSPSPRLTALPTVKVRARGLEPPSAYATRSYPV